VGSRSGRSDLLTVRRKKPGQADVILFADLLVPEQILHLCRPDAEIIRTTDFEEILPVMIEGAIAPVCAEVQPGSQSLQCHSRANASPWQKRVFRLK